MIHQKNFAGKDMVEIAIERLKMFEPEEGYWLAFSGGKDSCVIKELASMAKVKQEAHYNITTVDPPELTRFIRTHHPGVHRDPPEINMWDLIVKKGMPPTRIQRYCCEYLKEGSGEGRVVILGVRKAESAARSRRGVAEVHEGKTRKKIMMMNDNEEGRRTFENCIKGGKKYVNPIIDWSDSDVWGFIKYYRLPYCELYDQGFKRLGCIGCPMQGPCGMRRDFERWPHHKELYLRAFAKTILERQKKGLKTNPAWSTPEMMMKWWMEELTPESYPLLEELED